LITPVLLPLSPKFRRTDGLQPKLPFLSYALSAFNPPFLKAVSIGSPPRFPIFPTTVLTPLPDLGRNFRRVLRPLMDFPLCRLPSSDIFPQRVLFCLCPITAQIGTPTPKGTYSFFHCLTPFRTPVLLSLSPCVFSCFGPPSWTSILFL